MKHLLYSLLGILLLAGCKEDKYNVIIPMSDIYLSAPQDGTSIDLNDLSIDEYSFSWEKPLEKGAKLILGINRNFKERELVKIDAGKATTFSLSALTADQYFSQLGIKAGQEAVLYWTVKETGNTAAAASDARSIRIKRMSTKLIQPEDLTPISLAENAPETAVQFEWDTQEWPESTSYSLCLSLDPEMKQTVAEQSVGVVNGKSSLTHEELQTLLDKLSIKRWTSNSVYWNVKTDGGQLVSRSSGVLNMTEMMRFIDVRGDEKITYRVARIVFSDGKSQVWLADNLRTTKYPDGTNIETDKYMNTPASLGEGRVKAYGVHYHYSLRDKISPTGWHMPTVQEYQNLFIEAGLADGQWNVLKDPEYYESVKGKAHLNEWKFNLCAAGQWNGDAVQNHTGQYCYLLAADEEDYKCLLHDGGATLWHPWTTGAPARFIYNEN